MKKIAVIYHRGCLDGFAGAWVAWLKLKNKAEYIPVGHQEPVLKQLKGREVIYSIDFCYPRAEMERLVKRNKNVVILDHHISRKECLGLASDFLFDTRLCGCVLAWKYFFKGKPLPHILAYVFDLDVWKFKSKNSRVLTLFLTLLLPKLTFASFGALARDFENAKKRDAYAKQGSLLVDLRDRIVQDVVSNAQPVIFEKRKAYAVLCPEYLRAEVGHVLACKTGFLGIVFYLRNGEYKISLRSSGNPDVSKIAKQYGGGGLKPAAGFTWPLRKPLPFKFVKNNG